MAPVYGYPRRSGNSPWAMLRPGPRSALPRILSWMPLGPKDNSELAALIARAEQVDNPPYRTTEQETLEYFVDPIYSGVAGRDEQGVMRAFGLVRLRPAAEIYASMTGVVDPAFRKQGIGRALLYWQTERARHLVGTERAAGRRLQPEEPGPAHVITTVLEDDERMQDHLRNLGFEPRRWYREVRRSLSREIPEAEVDRFISVEPWTPQIDDMVRRAHNQAIGDDWGVHTVSADEWESGESFVVSEWSFVAMDRSSDRARVAGYLRSSRYAQDWEALGWREGYTDMLGVLSEYRNRGVGQGLLCAAMRAYAADGMDYAAAGVDTDNPDGASELYESLGYAPTRGTILYVLDV